MTTLGEEMAETASHAILTWGRAAASPALGWDDLSDEDKAKLRTKAYAALIGGLTVAMNLKTGAAANATEELIAELKEAMLRTGHLRPLEVSEVDPEPGLGK